MGSYVMRFKVLPEDTTTDLQKVVESVASVLPPDSKIRSHKIEPIAFGLSAVIVDIVVPEEEGALDKVETAVGTAPLIGQVEMQGVSRMSSRLPPQ